MSPNVPLGGIHLGDSGQTIVESFVFSLIAVATGVAILRYQLYEIDRIVSRTLAYATVTVLLGATYVGIVTLGAAVMPDAYGSIGVATATLAVAALFVPLRRRIQAVVDRRFNRSRYDAARTVDVFATSIRGDLTQAQLSGELLRTVQLAIAPTAASVWLVPR